MMVVRVGFQVQGVERALRGVRHAQVTLPRKSKVAGEEVAERVAKEARILLKPHMWRGNILMTRVRKVKGRESGNRVDYNIRIIGEAVPFAKIHHKRHGRGKGWFVKVEGKMFQWVRDHIPGFSGNYIKVGTGGGPLSSFTKGDPSYKFPERAFVKSLPHVRRIFRKHLAR